ncbi:MAG: CaiB/BaiF CoA transferase family protein [Gammaproteobacteria bacterium]
MSLLSGVRVVEMGLWVAGPSAGGMLADWGAEVIKVETPRGDPMRSLYRALSGSEETRCPPFDLYNRGKRSVTVDVNQPEGAAVAQKLISSADIFLTNMRPQYLHRVGLHHEQLLAANPKLVYGSLTGYGLEGPDKDAPGYDLAAFSARGGVSHRATPPGGVPPTLPGGIGDNVTAITLVAGLLGALFSRERTGLGQLVSTSLLRTGIFCVSMEMSARLAINRVAPSPLRTEPQNPLMNSYQTGDGKWLWLIGAEADRHWQPIAKALELDDLIDDHRFRTGRERYKNNGELVKIFDEVFKRRTRDEWATIFKTHDVWWAPVNSFEDLIEDKQIQAMHAFLPMPTIGGTDMQMSVATPVDFGRSPIGEFAPPPEIGADTQAVLSELNLTPEEIDSLRKAGVVG